MSTGAGVLRVVLPGDFDHQELHKRGLDGLKALAIATGRRVLATDESGRELASWTPAPESPQADAGRPELAGRCPECGADVRPVMLPDRRSTR